MYLKGQHASMSISPRKEEESYSLRVGRLGNEGLKLLFFLGQGWLGVLCLILWHFET